jgi:hypothetical protein
MLFDWGNDIFESEKERNLYYKLFGGYFFNELVPGFEQRLAQFCHLLDHPEHPDERQSQPLCLTAATTHVSFDNHAYLFEKWKEDRGELADIIVHDRSTRTLVFIEAKVHSDFSYNKDIVENSARIRAVRDGLGDCHAVHCLLIKQSKWKEVQRQVGNRNSQFAKLCADKDCTTRIVTWERFADICDNSTVSKFLGAQLKRLHPVPRYCFKDGWFECS